METKHTPGAMRAAKRLDAIAALIDQETGLPTLQARIDRLEAEKAELLEELKAIVESWDAIENKKVRGLREWEIDSRERSRAAIAKAEPSETPYWDSLPDQDKKGGE